MERSLETLLGGVLRGAKGMTPRSAAAKMWAPEIRFGGPRVFQNWSGQRRNDYSTEASAVRSESFRVPSFRPGIMEELGLDREDV